MYKKKTIIFAAVFNVNNSHQRLKTKLQFKKKRLIWPNRHLYNIKAS